VDLRLEAILGAPLTDATSVPWPPIYTAFTIEVFRVPP